MGIERSQNRQSTVKYDCVVLGAGIYGLYSAKLLAEKGMSVAIMDPDPGPFMRASYINQARIHNGYHYPRSYSTAKKSAGYFERFERDFSFAINSGFEKVYAVSRRYSLASGEQFEKFCDNTGIFAEEISPLKYFKPGTINAAFKTLEYAFDAELIRDWFVEKLSATRKTSFYYSERPRQAEVSGGKYLITTISGLKFESPLVINATYAGINQVQDLFGFSPFSIKYEICEIIRCDVSDSIKNVGITVMDGPFFSVMPFGINKGHSLTAVSFTPHRTSKRDFPIFSCQTMDRACTTTALGNCSNCSGAPDTAWSYMRQLSKKYLNDTIDLRYKCSLFAIKPILSASEIDDSRPTVIREFSQSPRFISVLSGKINTVYDLEKVLL